MPATNKAELRAIADKEFAKLQKLITPLESTTALLPDPEADGTTLKDIVGHRAHWIALFLGWYHDGQAGKDVAFPAPGYKWNDLKQYNADLRRTQSDLDWGAAQTMLHENHAKLLEFMDSLSEEELYNGPMKGANNKWTPGRWAEAAGPSHYRSAAKYIRQRLKALRA